MLRDGTMIDCLANRGYCADHPLKDRILFLPVWPWNERRLVGLLA